MNAVQLRKALAEIEEAEDHGFMHCLAVFHLVTAGDHIDECLMEYDELIVKAHPTDDRLDWGCGQHTAKLCRYNPKTRQPDEIPELADLHIPLKTRLHERRFKYTGTRCPKCNKMQFAKGRNAITCAFGHVFKLEPERPKKGKHAPDGSSE